MSGNVSDIDDSNLIGIFLAQFHVRTGNEIVWQLARQKLDLSGVEWKVLPSGSHLVERDIIHFEPPPSASGENPHRLGIAAFRNQKLGKPTSNSDDSNGHTLDQRGARMIAVGLVLDCASGDPSTHFNASAPHLKVLEQLAEAYAEEPSRGYQQLETYFHSPALTPRNLDVSRFDRLSTEYDPVLQLPSLVSAMGPIFPGLIKRLLQSSKRLLIFSSPPTFPAASLAYNLSSMAVRSDSNEASAPPLRVRGLIGLHDIARLSDENQARAAGGDQRGWISWTTDKLLLEKPQLYDLLLDITPIALSESLESTGKHAALPKLYSSIQVKDGKSSRIKFQLKPQSWTAKELNLFSNLDSRAVELAEISRSDPQHDRADTVGKKGLSTPLDGSNSRRGKFFFTLLTLIRYYLSGIWFLPRAWDPLCRSRVRIRSSAPLVLPLGIRGDGGARTSILIRDEGESESDKEDSQDDELIHVSDRSPNQRKGKGRALEPSISSSSLKQNRRRSSTSRPGDEETANDPLLVAAGARSIQSGRKALASHSNENRMPGDYLDQDAEDQVEEEELSEEEEAENQALFARALARVWSDWSRTLIRDLEELIRRVSDNEIENREGGSNGLVLGSKDLSKIGLSSANHVDVRLVESMAEECLGENRSIVVKRDWWKFF